MSTLVYFASGPNRKEYQNLDFDKVYLIDNCFRSRQSRNPNIIQVGKVICLGMDCLESIELLKKDCVQIDCFVSLNEGLYEGGGHYAINSDMFLGYSMPLLKDKYIHIMNKNYYHGRYNVSMDLPFKCKEITKDYVDYLDPFIFSKDNYHKSHARVYQMSKIQNRYEIKLNKHIKLSIVHDSIWNFYGVLETLVISFSEQGQCEFFDKLPKVINLKKQKIDNIFSYCIENKINKIGLTPWGRGNYEYFCEKLKVHSAMYPKEIILFHLNKNDYWQIKEYAGIKGYIQEKF